MWLALDSICNKLPPQRKLAQYANCGFYVIASDISTTLVSSTNIVVPTTQQGRMSYVPNLLRCHFALPEKEWEEKTQQVDFVLVLY